VSGNRLDSGQQQQRLWLEYLSGIVVTRKQADGLNGIKEINDDKFGFRCTFAAKNVTATVSRKAFQLWKNLVLKQRFIRTRSRDDFYRQTHTFPIAAARRATTVIAMWTIIQ
jgi:hypothetical protein